MNDDAIERLRHENPFPETLPAPAIEPLRGRLGSPGSVSGSRRRLGFGHVAVAAGIGVAVVVAVLALVLVGHRHGQTPAASQHRSQAPPGPPSQGTLAYYLNAAYQTTVKRDPACGLTPRDRGGTTTVSDGAPSRALLSAFGVLRRPATAADKLPQNDYEDGLLRVVDVRYIRRARVVNGVSYYLIPGQAPPPPGAMPLRCFSEQRAALQSLVGSLPATKRTAIIHAGTQMLARERRAQLEQPRGPYAGIDFAGIGPGGGGSCCERASRIPDHVSILLSIGKTTTIASGVVPDSVASVSLYYAKTPSQNVSTIIAKATRVITAAAINNVYVVKFANHGRPEPSAVVYRTATGAVLRGFDTNQ